MASQPFNEMKDRMERASTCYTSMQNLFVSYHAACAAMNWKQAEKVRGILLETVDASLDATAAVFKSVEALDPNGKEA